MRRLIICLSIYLQAMQPAKQITCPECETVIIHIEQARDIEIGTPEPIRKMRERKKIAIIAAGSAIVGASITAAVTITNQIYHYS